MLQNYIFCVDTTLFMFLLQPMSLLGHFFGGWVGGYRIILGISMFCDTIIARGKI